MDVYRAHDKKYVETFREMFPKYIFSRMHYYQHSETVPEISKAIIANDLGKVINLVESGMSINVFDYFLNGPFHVAVMKNNASIMDYLLSQDTKSIDHQNFVGETALFKAMMEEKFELAEKIILAGANVNICDNLFVTPLHLAVGTPRIAQLLIEHGAEINCTDKFSQTPLHVAVYFGNLEVVCMLLYYNADCSITNETNCTPFMVALEKRYIDIQEVLFEYVDDYDIKTIYSNYSALGLAIVHKSPFTEEMIMRGADVNNVNRYENGAFFLALRDSRSGVDLNIFKLIWERMDYESTEKKSVLGNLLLLESGLFHDIIDIFINTDKMQIITQSVCQADDFRYFTEKCLECGLPFEKFSALFYGLLSYGYTPSADDLTTIFYHWGYCEIFRILLHMDIRRNKSFHLCEIPIRLICEVNCTPNELLDKFVTTIRWKSYSLDALKVIVSLVLDYYAYPPLLEIYSKANQTDCITLKAKAMPKVPSLLELARNLTREHIKKTYKVTNSSQLYTLINNLDIAHVYKKILTLESIIYRPTFTEGEFGLYLKMLEAINLGKQVKDPLILTALRYSVIVDDANKNQQD